MLPKNNRLKLTSKEIRNWKDKKEIFTPAFKLVFHFAQDNSSPKIGFIISGKVGKAVLRNRIRRLLSEVCARHLDKLPKNIEAVFIVGRSPQVVNYEIFSDYFNKAIPKILLAHQ